MIPVLPRRASATLVAAVLVFGSAVVVSGAEAAPISETLTFTAVADTYVSEAAPTRSFATSSTLRVDRSSRKQSFLRFDVQGLDGRAVTGARLHLFQKDVSNHGGRLFALADNTWPESITWNTRPTGWETATPLAALDQRVEKGLWYDFHLSGDAINEGLLSFAMDSPSKDGSDWASRSSSTPLTLEVDVQSDDSVVLDGLSDVAPPEVGSSSPTYHAINHRVAVTESGRILALHGRHSTGVQLAWRDPWGTWQNNTTGDLTDGLLLRGTGTGDWPASIALADDSNGAQHAWVVWTGAGYNSPRPVEMRRLSDLDSPNGPTVGPKVTVAPAGVSGQTGNSKADIAFETAPDGTTRGVITWLRRLTETTWSYDYTWFTDVDSNTPSFHSAGTLFSYRSGSYQGTLESTPTGVTWVGRTVGGKLRAFMHDAGAPLAQWAQGPGVALSVGASAYPSAAAISSGGVLAVLESDTVNHVVSVVRFSPAGEQSAPELTLTGYLQPTIATDGAKAWVVMVRDSDGYVVSREFDGTSWSSQDRVEIGPEGGGSHFWPNAVRHTDGRLRFIVEGPVGGPNQNAVLAFQRLLE
ncbi:MAG: DNRLRE domain-containing protein [Actinomycetota bacterium]|nr:DNRLRE domain-containing protein [Actinomycetota bacterium]